METSIWSPVRHIVLSMYVDSVECRSTYRNFLRSRQTQILGGKCICEPFVHIDFLPFREV
jgi:hypothetical protein